MAGVGHEPAAVDRSPVPAKTSVGVAHREPRASASSRSSSSPRRSTSRPLGRLLTQASATDHRCWRSASSLVQVLLRGWRWRIVLPDRPDGTPVPVRRTIVPLLVGYLGNAVLPGASRGADPSASLSRVAKASTLMTAFGATMLERLIDIVTLAAIGLAAALAIGASWLDRHDRRVRHDRWRSWGSGVLVLVGMRRFSEMLASSCWRARGLASGLDGSRGWAHAFANGSTAAETSRDSSRSSPSAWPRGPSTPASSGSLAASLGLDLGVRRRQSSWVRSRSWRPRSRLRPGSSARSSWLRRRTAAALGVPASGGARARRARRMSSPSPAARAGRARRSAIASSGLRPQTAWRPRPRGACEPTDDRPDPLRCRRRRRGSRRAAAVPDARSGRADGRYPRFVAARRSTRSPRDGCRSWNMAPRTSWQRCCRPGRLRARERHHHSSQACPTIIIVVGDADRRVHESIDDPLRPGDRRARAPSRCRTPC